MLVNWRIIFSVVLILSLVPTVASADNAKINVESFRPASHTGDYMSTESSLVPGHMQWNAGVWLHYGQNPFVYKDNTNNITRSHQLIQNQLAVDLVGSLAIYDWVDIGLAVPIFLVNKGETAGFAQPASPIPGFAFGDIRLSPKVRIVSRRGQSAHNGFGLSISLGANLPTGDPNGFVSDGFAFEPTLIMDYATGPVEFAVNVGGRIREEACHVFLCVGNQITYRAATRWDIMPEFRVSGELYGASGLDQNSTYMEGVVAASLLLPSDGWAFTLGGGSGLLPGYGDTKFRLFAAINYAPAKNIDRDGDGVVDDEDQCPLKPEDKDGFKDDDGCPELDNDDDGIEDNVDKCPNDKEDLDGNRDGDGCPDLDNDNDQIEDDKDQCPNQAEDKDGYKDQDGCPDDDNDGDGVADSSDRCPNKPETKNFYQDDDGCPDETLAKLEEGRIVIKDKIFFDSGKATIKPYSFAILRAVAGILQTHPNIKRLSIEGHTDDRGGRKYNLELSQKRAEAVRKFIIDEGVGEERLVAVGHGKEKPASKARDNEAREANRRVEFLLLSE
jgi:large repetitive protein